MITHFVFCILILALLYSVLLLTHLPLMIHRWDLPPLALRAEAGRQIVNTAAAASMGQTDDQSSVERYVTS